MLQLWGLSLEFWGVLWRGPGFFLMFSTGFAPSCASLHMAQNCHTKMWVGIIESMQVLCHRGGE